MPQMMISPGRGPLVEGGLDPGGGRRLDRDTHDVIRVEPDGADHRMGPSDRLRTIRTVFANATDGYSAVDQLRMSGFRIDIAASIAGDLIVSIQAGRTQADEINALVAVHHGRIEQPLGT